MSLKKKKNGTLRVIIILLSLWDLSGGLQAGRSIASLSMNMEKTVVDPTASSKILPLETYDRFFKEFFKAWLSHSCMPGDAKIVVTASIPLNRLQQCVLQYALHHYSPCQNTLGISHPSCILQLLRDPHAFQCYWERLVSLSVDRSYLSMCLIMAASPNLMILELTEEDCVEDQVCQEILIRTLENLEALMYLKLKRVSLPSLSGLWLFRLTRLRLDEVSYSNWPRIHEMQALTSLSLNGTGFPFCESCVLPSRLTYLEIASETIRSGRFLQRLHHLKGLKLIHTNYLGQFDLPGSLQECQIEKEPIQLGSVAMSSEYSSMNCWCFLSKLSRLRVLRLKGLHVDEPFIHSLPSSLDQLCMEDCGSRIRLDEALKGLRGHCQPRLLRIDRLCIFDSLRQIAYRLDCHRRYHKDEPSLLEYAYSCEYDCTEGNSGP